MIIDRKDLIDTISSFKKKGFSYLVKILGIDYIDYISVLYILRNLDSDEEIEIEVHLNQNDLWVPTIINIFKGADWYERELYEMFGIEIKGRKVRKLLLEKFSENIYPLRKSFKWGTK